MSQPPPYGSPGGPPPNPDRRPLPPGWIEQWDANYKAWFYVNTAENPPRSSWVHPLGPPPPAPQPSGYAPPPGPPPPDRSYSPYPPQGGYGSGYGQPPPQPSYAQSPPPGPGYYGSPPPQGGYPPYGGAPPQENRGWFGSSTPQPTVVQQAPPKKSGPGMGTALLAGGAGLVGGALLMDAFEDHEDHEREEAYDAGYDQGYDQGFDQGDGDW
ncbi:hypothetical protein PYCCODRAFT_1436031 [Trametes coccinea BRFM310]|uniref:WW domain-containing protein n=1 Tax=Trametes coccinea (strain BRFM310) TaxID=1353009 RepID=A0A1Y2IKS3_TRAC3|nr:hypothetical protein PYCCODRAFT_1436031 [Trametes coccinea BRFM310]